MTTHQFTINGLDTRITISNGPNTTAAYSITFDESAAIVHETGATHYSGYCLSEILYTELCTALATRRRIEPDDIANALDARGLSCTCDEDDADDE